MMPARITNINKSTDGKTNFTCHWYEQYYQLQPVALTLESNNTNTLPPITKTKTIQRCYFSQIPKTCIQTMSTTTVLLIFLFVVLLGNDSLQMAAASPQSCILCDKEDLKSKDPSTNYEEFLFEHQVTRQDAITALRKLNDSFFEGHAEDSACHAIKCTNKIMKYCLGPQFINDHCWCELGHTEEGLPYVPHICYVGEKHYTTSVGSCFFYEEVKECCCATVLAKQWRHISGGTTIFKAHTRYKLILTSLLLLIYYFHQRFT